MKKYLPNNSELRIAIYTALATITLFSLGHMLILSITSDRHKGMDMNKMKMGSMFEMPINSIGSNSDNMMDMTMADMVSMMDGLTGKALEQEFISGMIPHHQGAVDMAKKILEDKTVSPEIKKFAEDIIKVQESEIRMMSEWLKKY